MVGSWRRRTYATSSPSTSQTSFNVSARSGTNDYHGSGFYQTRPVWGQSLNFFSEREGGTKESTGISDAYYRLYGGAIGGL